MSITPVRLARARISYPVSWWHVVVTLERNGYSHDAIGSAVGRTRGAVNSWKNRHAEPRHEDGERLILLWQAVTGHERGALPLNMSQVLSAAAVG